MDTLHQFLTVKTKRSISLVTIFCLLALFFPAFTSAAIFAPDPVSNDQCVPPYPTLCFNTPYVKGHCVGPKLCQADSVLGISGKDTAIGLGIVTAILGIGTTLLKLGSGAGTAGSSLSPYSSTNPYGAAGCTGTRYISPTPTSDPCGVYIPTTSTTNPNINLNQIGGGSTTVVTSGPASASLTVVPTSGGAPLAVTFTVTDTSAACAHAAVSLSAGDGTAPITAIPATTARTTHTPA